MSRVRRILKRIRVRRILKRIKQEPVVVALLVTVAANLGLDGVVTETTVAGVIALVLIVTRGATASRDHVDDVMDAETVMVGSDG